MIFVEIRPPDEAARPKQPDRIQVLVASSVKPKECSVVLKNLTQKDETLAHLKRVKTTAQPPFSKSPAKKKLRTTGEENGKSSSSNKGKNSSTVLLQVLLGRVENGTSSYERLIEKHQLEIQVVEVPGRPAESQQELQQFNQLWPTVYFHKNSKEYRNKELELAETEVQQMEFGVKELESGGGAVILCPATSKVVARACDEAKLQGISCLDNPLATPTILAIQGVSRKERQVASSVGMGSATFQRGQYLCNGYDIYVQVEPNVFEAMALVHSRIRRVIFCEENAQDGGLGGSGISNAVHCLPGTNHHYRAFRCTNNKLA